VSLRVHVTTGDQRGSPKPPRILGVKLVPMGGVGEHAGAHVEIVKLVIVVKSLELTATSSI